MRRTLRTESGRKKSTNSVKLEGLRWSDSFAQRLSPARAFSPRYHENLPTLLPCTKLVGSKGLRNGAANILMPRPR